MTHVGHEYENLRRDARWCSVQSRVCQRDSDVLGLGTLQHWRAEEGVLGAARGLFARAEIQRGQIGDIKLEAQEISSPVEAFCEERRGVSVPYRETALTPTHLRS